MNRYKRAYYRMYCGICDAEKKIGEILKRKWNSAERIREEIGEVERLLEETLEESEVRGTEKEGETFAERCAKGTKSQKNF